MVPEKKKAYQDLDTVQNGTDVMEALEKLSSLSKLERATERKQLLEYCKLDTLSMMHVLNKTKKFGFYYNIGVEISGN